MDVQAGLLPAETGFPAPGPPRDNPPVPRRAASSAGPTPPVLDPSLAGILEQLERERDATKPRLPPLLESIDYETHEHVPWRADQARRTPADGAASFTARWSLVTLTALAIATAAYLVNFAVENIAHAKFSRAGNTLLSWTLGSSALGFTTGCGLAWLVLGAVNSALAGGGALFVALVGPAAAGSGIPDVKCWLNGVDAPEVLSGRTLVAKVVGSIASVASGMAVGKEGPFVHTGACVGYVLAGVGSRLDFARRRAEGDAPGQWRPSTSRTIGEDDVVPPGMDGGIGELGSYAEGQGAPGSALSPGSSRFARWAFRTVPGLSLLARALGREAAPQPLRDLVTCGAAAGVAAAFRAPVGGVLFAMEEGATHWSHPLLWRAFWGTAVVSISLRALMSLCEGGGCGVFAREGTFVLFEISNGQSRFDLRSELGPLLLLGAAGGLLGSLFTTVNGRLCRWRRDVLHSSVVGGDGAGMAPGREDAGGPVTTRAQAETIAATLAQRPSLNLDRRSGLAGGGHSAALQRGSGGVPPSPGGSGLGRSSMTIARASMAVKQVTADAAVIVERSRVWLRWVRRRPWYTRVAEAIVLALLTSGLAVGLPAAWGCRKCPTLQPDGTWLFPEDGGRRSLSMGYAPPPGAGGGSSAVAPPLPLRAVAEDDASASATPRRRASDRHVWPYSPSASLRHRGGLWARVLGFRADPATPRRAANENVFEDTVCPSDDPAAGNFVRFACPDGQYNELGSLLFTTQDGAIKNLMSSGTGGEFGAASLLTFFVSFYALAILTYGVALPSGLFVPCILCGASYGRAVGALVRQGRADDAAAAAAAAAGEVIADPDGAGAVIAAAARRVLQIVVGDADVDEGTWALLGAASFLGGTMRMTVSLCVILLELTDHLALLPQVMMVLVVAKAVGDATGVPGVYDVHVGLKRLPYLEAAPPAPLSGLTAADAMSRPIMAFRRWERGQDLLARLDGCDHHGFPVQEGGVLLGVVTRADILGALASARALQPAAGPDSEAIRKVELLDPGALVDSPGWDWGGIPSAASDPKNLEGKIRGSGPLRRRPADVIALERARPAGRLRLWLDLAPLVHPCPHVVQAGTSLARCHELFRSLGLRHLLVTPGIDDVCGIITRRDLHGAGEEHDAGSGGGGQGGTASGGGGTSGSAGGAGIHQSNNERVMGGSGGNRAIGGGGGPLLAGDASRDEEEAAGGSTRGPPSRTGSRAGGSVHGGAARDRLTRLATHTASRMVPRRPPVSPALHALADRASARVRGFGQTVTRTVRGGASSPPSVGRSEGGSASGRHAARRPAAAAAATDAAVGSEEGSARAGSGRDGATVEE